MATTIEREAHTMPMLIEMLTVGLIDYPEAKIAYRTVNNRYHEFQIYIDKGESLDKWNGIMNIKAHPSITIPELIEALTIKNVRSLGGKYVNFRK